MFMIPPRLNTRRSTSYADWFSSVLAAGCCVLPIAIMYATGIAAQWVAGFGISDKAWSWIALSGLAAALAAVLLRQLWNRRCAAKS
jgi:uncharacterized membrane protein